ncbi:hypothetical protein F7725_027119, partial [Dissostichus mawsoni]
MLFSRSVSGAAPGDPPAAAPPRLLPPPPAAPPLSVLQPRGGGGGHGLCRRLAHPPNVSAASLEEDVLRPLAVNIAPPAGWTRTAREKKSLLKLLSNKKKPRPSPPSSPTLEAELAAAGEGLHGASGPETTGSSPSSGILDPEPPPPE